MSVCIYVFNVNSNGPLILVKCVRYVTSLVYSP